jgi:hypothetical protein
MSAAWAKPPSGLESRICCTHGRLSSTVDQAAATTRRTKPWIVARLVGERHCTPGARALPKRREPARREPGAVRWPLRQSVQRSAARFGRVPRTVFSWSPSLYQDICQALPARGVARNRTEQMGEETALVLNALGLLSAFHAGLAAPAATHWVYSTRNGCRRDGRVLRLLHRPDDERPMMTRNALCFSSRPASFARTAAIDGYINVGRRRAGSPARPTADRARKATATAITRRRPISIRVSEY